MPIVRSTFAVLAALLVHTTVLAQQTAPVTGRVLDPQGATVAGAEVLLANGPATRSTRSAADGGKPVAL